MNFSTLRRTNRQDGIALILAIVFLAVLSIIGAVVMQVSTRDLSESAVVLPKQRALYAADRAVEYSLNRDIIINLGQNGEPSTEFLHLATSNANKLRTSDGTLVNEYHVNVLNNAGPGSIVRGWITDEGPHNLPPHLAERHGSEFGANIYHVFVEASSNNDPTATGPLVEKTHIDASIVRLFKMDDDQIFRTSGGG
jgi:hypothetical protein